MEDMKKMEYANRLLDEQSPYLLGHGHNPVDWYPWGPEAFETARRENKPIFLSIGYSTCHWCHVMEEESFEDGEMAGLLNEVFVCIKVDREERPDIDNIYMTVCQILTGSGGWPLTLLLTPDGKPFFAGTYFPKHGRDGGVGLMGMATRIRELWKTKREELFQSADQVMKAVGTINSRCDGEGLGEEVLAAARKQMEQEFDGEYGGFGESMKFPTPHTLLFLLRYWKRTGDGLALEMVEKTLGAMRRGGIYDQIGFGFHRYAVDRLWRVPHYEKMLYDQALIAMAYLEAAQATGKRGYGDTAREIFTYVIRDLMDPEGGFYCAQDADSEGEEGKYYLWTWPEVQKIFKNGKAEFVRKVFGVGEDGENILHLPKSVEELAVEMNLSAANLQKHIEEVREWLLAVRDKRVPPATDDKILTDWNGLMIAALAIGGRVLDDPSYALAATRAFKFILHQLRTPEGRLLHRFRTGRAAIAGNLNDYAFMTWAALELYETTFESDYLEIALHFSEILTKHFWDESHGGFFMTADDASDLVLRPKEYQDGAVPSGNSVGALNFRRLARMTGRIDLEETALRIERSAGGMVRQSPSGYTQLMCAVELAVGPCREVVIAGNSKGEDTEKMLRALRGQYLPHTVVLLRPTEQEAPGVLRLARYVEAMKSFNGRATAYVCRNKSCQPPTTEVKEMMALLKKA
jgi:uncharacterized protein